jgi:hypothetical protein
LKDLLICACSWFAKSARTLPYDAHAVLLKPQCQARKHQTGGEIIINPLFLYLSCLFLFLYLPLSFPLPVPLHDLPNGADKMTYHQDRQAEAMRPPSVFLPIVAAVTVK